MVSICVVTETLIITGNTWLNCWICFDPFMNFTLHTTPIYHSHNYNCHKVSCIFRRYCSQTHITGWASNAYVISLQWRYNERDVSYHQRLNCLPNRLFRHRSQKTSKVHVIGLCVGNSYYKGPVTLKMFPFDDVIMFPVYKSRSAEISLTSVESCFKFQPFHNVANQFWLISDIA